MTLEAARQILAYFPGASHLSLAGFGEPLLAQDLFRIIAEARKRPMRVSIITNGTLLRDRMDELLRAKAHSVSISMNSLDAADYQRVCGGSENTFQRLLEGIEMLIGKRTVSRPLVRISFVLSRNLLDRTEEMIRLAEKMKVDSLDFHNMIQHDLSKGFQGMLTADDEEVLRRFSEWSRRSYKVKIGWPKLIKKSLSRPENICYPSWDWLGVDMEGNVAGCSKVMTAKKKYGNLFSEGNKVWNNEFRKELRAEFLKREFLYDCCKTCTEVQL
jgi:radical SAM protein with 4Fe4S-binding SPASM domain